MFAEKNHCAQRVTPTTPRILAAYKERQGLREKGWAWLPMLGALVVGAAVVTVGAMLLYKNFKTTGNDAAMSSGQSSNRADVRPKPSDAKPQLAEAELTEDMTAPKEELAASNTMKEVKCDSGAAGTTICPGLWELTYSFSPSSTISSAERKELEAAMADTPPIDLIKQMEASMAYMPPAERKKMETAIADMKQRNVKIDGAMGMSQQHCVTPEDARKWAIHSVIPVPQHEKCTTITSPQVGNTQKAAFTCPRLSAEAALTVHGNIPHTAFTITLTETEENCGSATIQVSGLWLASDCGAVKGGEWCKDGATACAFASGRERGCK